MSGMEQRYAGDNAWNDLVDAFNGVYSKSDIDILTKKWMEKEIFQLLLMVRLALMVVWSGVRKK